MPDGQLESIWSQLNYATRTLSPVRIVLKVTLFLLLHCTGVFLCFWGVLTRLDTQPSQTCSEGYTVPATELYRGVSLYLGSIN